MHRLIIVAVVASAACGSGSLTDLEGIYAIDAWNRNPASCADPGPSVLGMGDTHFYIKTESFIGAKFVNMKSCASQLECEMMSGEADTIHLGEFATFEDGNDDAGWTSRTAFAFSFGGMCQGSVDTKTLTRDATGVVLRAEEIDVMYPERTGTDACPDTATEAAAVGQPCTTLEVVHGVFVVEL